MILPKLPYRFKKASQDIIEFRGLNKTENYKDGNLRDSIGLSTAEYPTLTQSKPFVAQGQSNIIDMHEHNGKLLTISKDGDLYFDGQYLGKVQANKKQYAAVNTRLCIFPDKMYIDLENMVLLPLTEVINAPDADGAVEVVGQSITFNSDLPIATGIQQSFIDSIFGGQNHEATFIYGAGDHDENFDVNAVISCWDENKKMWRNLRDIEQSAYLANDNAYGYGISVGAIFIPDSNLNILYSENTLDDIRDSYNKEGIYGVITGRSSDGYGRQIYTYNCYRATDNIKKFAEVFSTGDIVDIGNTTATLYDGNAVKIKALGEDKNSIVFDDDTFSGAVSYYELTEDINENVVAKVNYYDWDSGETVISSRNFKVNIFDTIKAGKVVYFRSGWNATYMYVWDKDKLKTIAKYEAEEVSANADIELAPYDVGIDVTVSKHIPDLDYICESENRLWGVSNRTHTIYASALGLPGVFTEFDVVSTDSYAVAVASEDDFTAICAYGGGVCCFKENRLHKILGSFPAEYYMNEYEIAGVQKGSERSLQIIDEVLYYKGRYGVYAYSGGVPRLVSYELGNIESAAKASVADGLNYYISLDDGVYVYDKLHGLWMKQTDLTCNAMVTDGQLIYGLSNGAMFVNSGKVADSKWSAEFTPFDMQGFFKKGFAKLIISAEMGKGAVLSVHVREDNQSWRKVYNQAATSSMLLSVPLRVGRCDRFSVKIEGKGIVKLRGISRDVIVGSER